MEHSLYITKTIKIPKVGTIPLYVLIVIFVFGIAVLQDFIYSILKNTGFYISESLLYNTFYILCIPCTLGIARLFENIPLKNTTIKVVISIAIGAFFSFLHIVVFTSLFVAVSNVAFSTPHRFSAILKTAFSNQLYIALLWYSVFPLLYCFKKKPEIQISNFSEKLKLKIGSKLITVSTKSIQFITTDKPYSVVYTTDQKFLDTKSLKEFERELDPKLFLRVHRSTILNATCIKELKSRSNGDYDATLENGQTFRLSRHYRSNWKQLLQ